MLIDSVTIVVKAGDGGDGAVHFRRNAQTPKGGPDGGNGGKGGSVYFEGVDDIDALREFRYKKNVAAEGGVSGGRQNLFGRSGKDLVIKVPFGTTVQDLERGSTFEISKESGRVLFATGGKGGRGNKEFATATHQTPRYAEKGEKVPQIRVLLTLRLIADVGLVGLPNAGKSSLLAVLTNANPKIGDYPFTTLEPNLGVADGTIIADIPGLIEGASQGKGLGIKFLQHIEKTKLLLHCIDPTGGDFVNAYTTVRNEFGKYNPLLLEKKEIIVLTKSDEVSQERLQEAMKTLKKFKREIIPVSAYDDKSLNALTKLIKKNALHD